MGLEYGVRSWYEEGCPADGSHTTHLEQELQYKMAIRICIFEVLIKIHL
jgi:hypothetical protein